MNAETRGSLRGGVGLPAPEPDDLGAAGGSLVRRGLKAWGLREPAAGADLAPPAEHLVVHPQKDVRPRCAEPRPVAIDPRLPRSSAAQ